MDKKLNELHNKLEKHLSTQSEKWKSFVYAKEKGFYQGFEEIKINGCRPTEERFQRYNIEKYLKKEKNALDIGCNCGFFTLFASKYLKNIDGVDVPGTHEVSEYEKADGSHVDRHLRSNPDGITENNLRPKESNLLW